MGPALAGGGFKVATYNILATAYIKPEWYPFTPKELLEPALRASRLTERLAAMKADILCLQEVETEIFGAFHQRLKPLGYEGELSLKRARPEGCAIFCLADRFKRAGFKLIEYRDETGTSSRSGHVAQLIALEDGERRLGVANTHLKWDPPDASDSAGYGQREVRQLLAELPQFDPDCGAWVICGDFNAEPSSPVVQTMCQEGFEPSHGQPSGATCNSMAVPNSSTISFTPQV